MAVEDWRLVAAAVLGIALSILMIVRGRLHPFIALLCGAFAVGLLAGEPLSTTSAAVQKGAGDILGGTGLVVALGLVLGAMLQVSDGAASLARAALGRTGARGAPWASLATAMVIGLPLFFETGLVLLLPVLASAAAAMADGRDDDALRLRLMLPALAGLSVLHALVPPHPGPLLAVSALHASLARTMTYGVVIAIPIAIVAGPVLGRWTARGVRLSPPPLLPLEHAGNAPPAWRALFVMLLPVALIAVGQAAPLLPSLFSGLGVASNPVLALLIACLVALPLLFGRRLRDSETLEAVWVEAMAPAGTILLSIGAGGALKQVLVSAGLSDLLARVAAGGPMSPLLLAWAIAVAVRLATGSATVATITTAGIVPALVVASGVSPEWTVLAIGAGSIFFSHVNDPGFWLVKNYLGTSTAGTFRTWSLMETVVSVMGLALVLVGSRLL